MTTYKIRIKNTSPTTADVFIDDKQIVGCTDFKFEHSVGNLATLTLYSYGDTEIDEEGIVVIDKSPRPISTGEKLSDNVKGTASIEMSYIDFLLKVESALRNNIVVWEDEEYREIAERVTRELTNGESDV